MEFIKAHGCGNDFVLLADLADEMTVSGELVRALCDRHLGIGADGLIRIVAGSAGGDYFMDYWNADGGVAEMCGNGIRCLAKYVCDRGLFRSDRMRVETRAGLKEVEITRDADGLVERVRVDMGPPIFERSEIPVAGEGDPLHEPLFVEGHEFDALCLSMGNPHCVLFVDDLDVFPFEELGPAVERAPKFPARVNAEFVQVVGPDEVRMRVYERGVGETQACGSGACAVGVASALRGVTGRTLTVHMPGGAVDIEWAPNDHVYMSGPAAEVFSGTLDERFERALREGALA